MTSASFEHALAVMGILGTVEARGALAVVSTRDTYAFEDDRVRDAAVALALEHGFTSLALELLEDDDDAAIHCD